MSCDDTPRLKWVNWSDRAEPLTALTYGGTDIVSVRTKLPTRLQDLINAPSPYAKGRS